MKRLFILILCFQAGSCLAQQLRIHAPVKMLALGDSYTYGESVSVAERWPNQLMTVLGSGGIACEEVNFVAVSGWTTGNLKKGIEKAHLKNEYNLVSLLIGVNNYYQGGDEQTYRTEFEELLKTAITLAQDQKSNVVVISIPDYGYTPFGSSQQAVITEGINSFNAINKAVSSEYGVPYVSITDISRQGLQQPELVAIDRLHPSGKQYALWVNRLLGSASISATIPDDSTITGIEDEHPVLGIYPNPFQGRITLHKVPAGGNMAIFTLTDVLGRVVIEEIILPGHDVREIMTADLPAGLYTYRLLDASGKFASGKLIKE